MSDALEALAPRIRAMLIDAHEPEQLDVRIVDLMPSPEQLPSHATLNGATIDGETILIAGQGEDLQGTLAHELVHALAGDSWFALTPAAREGLANAVAKRVLDHEPASSRRLLPSLMLSIPETHLELAWHTHDEEQVLYEFEKPPHAAPSAALVLGTQGNLLEAIASGEVDPQAAYAIGSFVLGRAIDRAGLPELQRLCAEARSSAPGHLAPQVLLAMADLEPDVGLWWPALAEELEPAALEELVRDNVDVIAEAIVGAFGERSLANSAVAAGEVVIREATRGATLELRMVPELAALLERAEH